MKDRFGDVLGSAFFSRFRTASTYRYSATTGSRRSVSITIGFMDSFAEGLCVGLHSMCISPNCRAPNLKNETLNPASFTILGLGAVEFGQSNCQSFRFLLLYHLSSMSKTCQFTGRVIELPVLSAPIHSIEDDDAAQSTSVYTLWSISSHAFHRIALSEHVLHTMCFTICFV